MKKIKIKVNKSFILDIVRASIMALILSLIGVLLLALCVKLFQMTSKAILPVNQVIKLLSILGGCFLGFKTMEKGAIKGGTVGVVYVLLSILVFGLLENTISFRPFHWLDLVAGLIAGVISGILAVNFRKKQLQ